MKICVCFKAVYELEKVIPSDWESFDVIPDIGYVGTMIGYYDEIALELALQFKDNNEEAKCIAITLGELPPRLSKKIYAAGFDEVVCLDCSNTEFAPKQVAEKLSNYLVIQNPDLIITGKQTSTMDSGTVPIHIAENMRVPVVTDVVSCTLNQGVLCIEHETPGGLCATDVKTPILLSMGNSEITALRLATFSAQLAAGKRIVWHMEEKPVISLDHTFIKNEAHICQFIKEDSNFQTEFVMELVSKGSEL